MTRYVSKKIPELLTNISSSFSVVITLSADDTASYCIIVAVPILGMFLSSMSKQGIYFGIIRYVPFVYIWLVFNIKKWLYDETGSES